jgi:hypothetical protein
MKLMASAGLAFDYVHLNYLAKGDLRVTRTERDLVFFPIRTARPKHSIRCGLLYRSTRYRPSSTLITPCY